MTDREIRIASIKKYIEENLTRELTLSELADRANISPFHFQKVFKSEVGETPKQYIVRLRLEAAAHQMVLKTDTTVLEVAMKCGFNSLESFSRAFKQYYGISPDKFRKSVDEEKLIILSEKLQTKLTSPFELSIDETPGTSHLDIEIVKLGWKKLIYIPRTLLDYDADTNGFSAIKKWANARELLSSDAEYVGLMRDFPAITSLEKCRFHTGIIVSETLKSDEGVTYEEISPRTYAVFTVSGDIRDVVRRVTSIFTDWLPTSGYELHHTPALVIPGSDPTVSSLKDMSNKIYLGLQPSSLK